MDFEFENRYDIKREDLLEVIKCTKVRKRRWRLAFMFAFSLAYAIYAVLPPSAMQSFTSLVLCCAFIVFLIMISPIISLKATQNSLLAEEGSLTPNRTLQFGEHIHLICENSQKSIVYRQITEIIQTKNMFILTDHNNIVLYVLKNSFTYGEFEQWEKFILNKCYHANYKKIYKLVLPVAVKQN